MKIAVVGCGALGSYYGAMLSRAGHDVHFLLRSDYETVRRKGVLIRSGGSEFTVHPKCAQSPADIGVSDVLLIGLKTTANDQFARLLPPLVASETRIVTLQNGLGNEEQLARLFPVGQILGGLCFVCLNRISPGVIVHTGHGVVVLGEHRRTPLPRTHELASMFKQAGVPCKVTESLERAHWEKLIWNIPFNGLGVAAVAGLDAFIKPSVSCHSSESSTVVTTDRLLQDPAWRNILRELMLEVIAIAGALGFSIPESYADAQIERTIPMGAYKASTLVDFERRQPLELESLFLEPLRQGRAAGVVAPRLESLCRVLSQLDAGTKSRE